MTAIVPPLLDAHIHAQIASATRTGLVHLLGGSWPRSNGGKHLFVKFTSARYGAAYRTVGVGASSAVPTGLFVSTSAGFTWGQGCYVTPLLYPVSNAIYGRCGIVAEADPAGWRLFDATDPVSQQLYLDWASFQPYYRALTLTTHSQLANQYLRNAFRRQYRIDCVVFPPDELNPHYTRRRVDRWLAVSHWSGSGDLAAGYCSRFLNPRLAVVLAEEFEASHRGIGRRSVIGPTSLPIDHVQLARDIATAYNTSSIATVTA